MIAVVSLLGGFAITAVAIAPLAPDASELPRRLVTEPVRPADMPSQLEALAAHEFTLF
ncbi:MAG: M23 family peptidase, partial [Chitinophagaceae bacterium]|nr:M23 family peptidase [Rubrivivax sp.]